MIATTLAPSRWFRRAIKNCLALQSFAPNWLACDGGFIRSNLMGQTDINWFSAI